MSATSTTGRAALVAANGRARRPAEPPQGDLSHAEALRGRERRDFKPTGVYYLPDMPCNWEIKKAKVLFRQERRPVRPDDGVVTCFRDGQVTLRANRRTEGFTNSLKEIGYQGVRKGDLVIHNMDAFAGSVGVSESDGKMSPVCSICTPLRDDVDVKYYAQVLRVLAYSGFIKSLAKGIRERSTDFRFSDFKELLLPLPPLPEQKEIVAYLDAETGRIDKAIAAEEKMIALLQERREIVINEAVDGGERRNGRRVVPLRFLCECLDSRRVPVDASNRNPGPYPYWGAGSIQSYVDKYIFDEELVLLGEDGAPFFDVGRPVAHYVNEKVWINNHIHVLRVRKKLIASKYLVNALNCADYKPFITGAILPKLTQANMNNIPIPLPPLPEQEKIVKRLDAETGKIDRAIEVKRRQIELLRERRQIVIDEVVTGKVKVA